MITTGYTDEGTDTGTDTDTANTLVLIHGHPFDRTMWHPQIAYARQAGWRVIAPDLRGYGENTDTAPPAPGKTRLETFAEDIIGLLDTLGIERFVLGGLSMGGQIVMECHRQFAHRIRGLLLADTFAAADTDEGRALRRTTAERLLREGMAGYAQEVLPKTITPRNVHAQPAVARHVLDMMRGASPEGAAAALRGRAERRDYTGLLSGIEVPTLVVVGEEDAFTPVSDARIITERIPGATLKVIAQAGHLPNLERPAEFNAALGDFLDSLPSPAEAGS
ncbi:alpha/beta fold hydrolase [Streptomyces gilvosporeus]|uniref:Alpha/beta hydrolase n=1 Tax=Streptomyces gilvosporeus TaxID=553510 RepID=A0A1V0TZ72_9ACTN|nr:alpha/beta fold hydrolase [Streptomyces gilvosporeus]ARF58279.1 alpha/beta hydrolase [Streptomyces gilvosporeus]